MLWEDNCHLKSLRGFWIGVGLWNMSEFWIFVNFRKFDRVLNMQQDVIMKGFWIFQDSEYASFMTRLWICEGYTGCRICLNKPEYALISLDMREYALTILSVSDAVRSPRSLYKLLCSYQDRSIQNIVKHLRWSVLQKELCLGAGAQPEVF